jgi:hypothetical protein
MGEPRPIITLMWLLVLTGSGPVARGRLLTASGEPEGECRMPVRAAPTVTGRSGQVSHSGSAEV